MPYEVDLNALEQYNNLGGMHISLTLQRTGGTSISRI